MWILKSRSPRADLHSRAFPKQISKRGSQSRSSKVDHPKTRPPKSGSPNTDPKIRSRAVAGWELTSGTGCRDKLSADCRAPRWRRPPPALQEEAVPRHRVPNVPNIPTSPWPHLAALHPAAPSPTPAPATRAARTPGTASPRRAAPGPAQRSAGGGTGW